MLNNTQTILKQLKEMKEDRIRQGDLTSEEKKRLIEIACSYKGDEKADNTSPRTFTLPLIERATRCPGVKSFTKEENEIFDLLLSYGKDFHTTLTVQELQNVFTETAIIPGKEEESLKKLRSFGYVNRLQRDYDQTKKECGILKALKKKWNAEEYKQNEQQERSNASSTSSQTPRP